MREPSKLTTSAALALHFFLFCACNSAGSTDTLVGKSTDEFEKYCRDRQMAVSSSSHERLYLRGERRAFKEIHCSGGTGAATAADAFAVGSTVYSVELSGDESQDSRPSEASASGDTLRVSKVAGRKSSLTDYGVLTRASILANDSVLWEMGPALVEHHQALPKLFSEPLSTFGPLALGMTSAAFIAAMGDLKVSNCKPLKFDNFYEEVVATHRSILAQQEAIYDRNNVPQAMRTPVPAPKPPKLSAITCNREVVIAIFLDDHLSYITFRSTNPKKEIYGELDLMDRLASRAVSDLVGSAVVMSRASIDGASAARFYSNTTALARFPDGKRNIVLMGNVETAKRTCLHGLVAPLTTHARAHLHPLCGELLQVLSLIPCPAGMTPKSSASTIGGTYIFNEGCAPDPAADPVFNTAMWLSAADELYYLAQSKRSPDAAPSCYTEDRKPLSCETLGKMFDEGTDE